MIAPPALVAYASYLAAQPVAVRCIRDDSASLRTYDGGRMVAYTYPQTLDDGRVVFGRYQEGQFVAQPTIFLKAGACKALVLLVTPGSKLHIPHQVQEGQETVFFFDDPSAWSLEDLVHEAMHIRLASTDEALVECTTARNAWMALRVLHRSPAEDRFLLADYERQHRASPPDYLKDC